MTISAASAAPTEALDLSGRKGLVVGIANEHSLAWSAARHFRNAGAELTVTYLNEKAKPFVEPLATELAAPMVLPCDVATPGQLDAVFEEITAQWGRLDFLFHSIAWARKEDLHGRLTDCSAEGFAESMLVSCHSFIRMAKLAEPLMAPGSSLTTLSFFGAERVVDHYNVMGPVKAALEASVRYLAHELGGGGSGSMRSPPVPSRPALPPGSITSMNFSMNHFARHPCGAQSMPAKWAAPRCSWRATMRPASRARCFTSMPDFMSPAWSFTEVRASRVLAALN